MLRKYQLDAVEAITAHPSHSLACLPTGGGKSWIIAELCKQAQGRVLVLAHVKELLAQNAEKIGLLTGEEIGIFCAGMGSKDSQKRITVASVQSLARADAGGFSVIIVDEAHRIPKAENGQYHQIFKRSKEALIVGLTATPYRMDGGLLYKGSNRLFDKLVYNAKIADLIADRWLAPIVGYRGSKEANLDGVHTRQGDFVVSEQAERFEDILHETAEDLLAKSKGRKAVLVFCASIKQAIATRTELWNRGEPAEVLTGNDDLYERDDKLARFRKGEFRTLVNVDILTTGFDRPDIDCIVLLRATKSAGLYVQMVGRGLRTAGDKTDCLLLDYGGNIRRHGPLDEVEADVPQGVKRKRMSKTCKNCEAECGISAKTCKHCGAEFEVNEREVKHTATAAVFDPMKRLGPVSYEVKGVRYFIHRKPGKPDSLRVEYDCGLTPVREWVCPEHEGYAKDKARTWFTRHGVAMPKTALDALERSSEYFTPVRITVIKDGKFERIIGYEF